MKSNGDHSINDSTTPGLLQRGRGGRIGGAVLVRLLRLPSYHLLGHLDTSRVDVDAGDIVEGLELVSSRVAPPTEQPTLRALQ